MPVCNNDSQLIGLGVSVTLADDTTVNGTVYTYNSSEGLLVLFQGFSGSNPNVKIIRTPFIKEVTALRDNEEKLPPQLEAKARLPSMQAARDRSLFKHASSQLRNAKDKRNQLLQTDDQKTPIAALDTLIKLERIYPDIHWDKDAGVIRFNQDVVVKGKPDWTSPAVVIAEGAGDISRSLMERVQKTLSKK
ncbi:Lsm12 protein, putative [Trypanosoma equiperdum]|uniref:PBP1-interacting protein LSM12 n=2 Tax=Trypanozoon TaxID=39700 RepID=LSM12_TRYB2|nr:p21 antigen protein, putative [Trypanosoma brucei brucei TREU927]Q38E83.1 RecName: Full=PBP1-interacting protein LSM12 [Trypanosoma brucei brucei TREU927]EAN76887.1 p21 antigen protein, putative [Trypanosoma brucei brucei TREU927]SCU64392.1 Lsm12 protein, putative [Trypanosoma equiperdum]